MQTQAESSLVTHCLVVVSKWTKLQCFSLRIVLIQVKETVSNDVSLFPDSQVNRKSSDLQRWSAEWRSMGTSSYKESGIRRLNAVL